MKSIVFSVKALLAALALQVLTLSSVLPGQIITRMGSSGTRSFDEGWLFARFGLQADGTSLEEPSGIEKPDFSDAGWRKLNLPHDWAIEGPFRVELPGETGKLPYQGIGWYRKHFSVPAEDAGKIFYIDFDGAMANAQVWLNGHLVGTWPYGYSSFRFELTPYLVTGSANVLAVKLDTEKWESRWYPGAGIYRHVWLIKTNPVHVGHWGTYVTTPEINRSSAVVKMDISVENKGKTAVEVTVKTNIYELDAQNRPRLKAASCEDKVVRVEAGSSAKTSTRGIIQNPKLWDIDSPFRYVIRTTIMVDGKVTNLYNTPLGIRTLRFTTNGGFLLNGRRVPIQGTCNHHDLGALGAAINTSALTRQLTILKEMGCNSLRTSHNPPASDLIDLADRMGFLVMDEAFDCWKTGKKEWDYNKLYDQWYEKDLRAMIRRDRNNPSVFIWSIGNEVPDQRDVEMTRHLAEIVRSEDPTRPVTNGYNDPDNSREAGSPLSLDLMGVNYFFGQQAKWDADPRYIAKPTIGTETSSCITSRGEYFFGKEYQNWQISSYDLSKPGWGCTPDEQFRINYKFPHLLGEFVWTGFDYLGEPTPYTTGDTLPPSRSSYFGIIDLAGFPKDRFWLYQSQWKPDLPMAHILPHWNWEEMTGQAIPVHVYTSGTEAELFVNGKSQGRKVKKPGEDFRLVWDKVIYEPGQAEVITYKYGQEWARDVVKTTGKPAVIALSSDRKVLNPDGTELAFITVRIEDQDGLTVPRSHPLIRFTISGPGEIVATDNGDPTSWVPFNSKERETFNGLALVIVRARKGATGTIYIRATGDGLKTGTAEITTGAVPANE